MRMDFLSMIHMDLSFLSYVKYNFDHIRVGPNNIQINSCNGRYNPMLKRSDLPIKNMRINVPSLSGNTPSLKETMCNLNMKCPTR
jgi:hypothetical protein